MMRTVLCLLFLSLSAPAHEREYYEDTNDDTYEEETDNGAYSRNHRNRHSTRAVQMQGHCMADDDSFFDWGVHDMGYVEGTSLIQLIESCQDRSLSYLHSHYVTVGLKHVRVLGHVPRKYVTGVCYIDDDYEFDYGFFRVGEMAAFSAEELEDQCEFAARTTYRNGTSGVKLTH